MHPLIGLITVLTVLLLIVCMILVARARGRYQVKAPATTGPEGFERMLRIQANTNESTLMFLPALWCAGWFHQMPALTAALGATWIVARVFYAITYLDPAKKRTIPYVVSMLCVLALMVQAGWGLFWHLML